MRARHRWNVAVIVAGTATLATMVAGCSSDTVTLNGSTVSAVQTIGPAPKLAGTSLPTMSFTTFTGETVTFADRVGKPVVLNVWSETCEPCKREMPDLQAIHQEFGPRITVVGVNSQDSLRRAKLFADKAGVTYELWHDPSGRVFGELKLPGLPATILADGNGRIVSTKFGVLTAAELRARLNEAFPA